MAIDGRSVCTGHIIAYHTFSASLAAYGSRGERLEVSEWLAAYQPASIWTQMAVWTDC